MDLLTDAAGLALQNLLTPAILFFALGVAAGFARSDLVIPEQATKTIALYLMLCIGFKGGVEAARAGLSPDFLKAAGAGGLLSLSFPILAYFILRGVSRLERTTAAATAAAYGSVSVVTFAAGSEFLRAQGLAFGGYMAAVLALMETPAILSGLLLAGASRGVSQFRTLLHEVFLSGAAVLLTGSFLIGVLTGEPGLKKLDLFVNPLFQGVLCLFLLDMGLTTSRSLVEATRLPLRLVVMGIILPLTGAALGLGLARLAGLAEGDTALLTILAGSASYIAVPSAMRMALPKADPGVYLTLSLGITFPFNLLVGIPLYQFLAGAAAG